MVESHNLIVSALATSRETIRKLSKQKKLFLLDDSAELKYNNCLQTKLIAEKKTKKSKIGWKKTIKELIKNKKTKKKLDNTHRNKYILETGK